MPENAARLSAPLLMVSGNNESNAEERGQYLCPRAIRPA
jgi:hypothetical protein